MEVTTMLMRTDPFRELDRLAEHVLGTSARPAVMPMDAYRDGESFVVELDLPGVSVEAISLDVERNVLTVRAERPGPQQGREMVAAERPAGVFSRQLFLGDTLDTERVQASYRDGVLRLTIPVAERAKPRRIEIGQESSGDDRTISSTASGGSSQQDGEDSRARVDQQARERSEHRTPEPVGS
jgi:HSP20 family protein